MAKQLLIKYVAGETVTLQRRTGKSTVIFVKNLVRIADDTDPLKLEVSTQR